MLGNICLNVDKNIRNTGKVMCLISVINYSPTPPPKGGEGPQCSSKAMFRHQRTVSYFARSVDQSHKVGEATVTENENKKLIQINLACEQMT